MEENY